MDLTALAAGLLVGLVLGLTGSIVAVRAWPTVMKWTEHRVPQARQWNASGCMWAFDATDRAPTASSTLLAATTASCLPDDEWVEQLGLDLPPKDLFFSGATPTALGWWIERTIDQPERLVDLFQKDAARLFGSLNELHDWHTANWPTNPTA